MCAADRLGAEGAAREGGGGLGIAREKEEEAGLGGGVFKAEALNDVDAERERATPAEEEGKREKTEGGGILKK